MKRIMLLVLVAMIALSACGGNTAVVADSDPAVSVEQPDDLQPVEEETDLSAVDKVYELTGGHYVAGVDIPSGTCNVIAISGRGLLNTSNASNGGANEAFGIDDGSGFYLGSFNNLKLPEGTRFSITGRLVVKLEYSKITSDFSGREYNEDYAVTLTTGNYTAGVDFAEGVYDITAVSGTGNLFAGTLSQGGLKEMFGIDNGMGAWTEKAVNIYLVDGLEVSVSGGLTVKLLPSRVIAN